MLRITKIALKIHSLEKSYDSVIAKNTNDNPITRNRRAVEAGDVEQSLTTTDLGPIVGYAEVPLLPLARACAPLNDSMYNLWFYVQLAIDGTPEEPSDGLTVDESAAIRLYTIE